MERSHWLILSACLVVSCMSALFLQGFRARSETAPPVPGSCAALSNIRGFLIDLDGTMYNPNGLVPGAKHFFQWLKATNTPFVFLSNSGAKGAEGVQAKFMTAPWVLQQDPIGLRHAFTGADAVSMWLRDNAPAGSRLFILQSISRYGNQTDGLVHVMERLVPEKLKSWVWRTDMNDTDIETWATDIRAGVRTFVVLSNDGMISDEEDPVTHRPGYADWSYKLLIHARQLLDNGATLISSAPDPSAVCSSKDGLLLDTIGPGPFTQLLKSSIYPRGLNRTFCSGKGGNAGSEYMYKNGLELLRSQGFTGGLEHIAMVGDVFATDIKGGHGFGVNTFLVQETGCNTAADARFFPDVKPTCVFRNVGEIPPAGWDGIVV